MVVDRLTRAIIIVLAVSPSLLAHPVPRSTRSTVYHVFLFILFLLCRGGFLIRVPLTSGGFYIRLDSSSFHATTSFLFVLFIFFVCLFCFCSLGSREPYLHFLALPVTEEARKVGCSSECIRSRASLWTFLPVDNDPPLPSSLSSARFPRFEPASTRTSGVLDLFWRMMPRGEVSRSPTVSCKAETSTHRPLAAPLSCGSWFVHIVKRIPRGYTVFNSTDLESRRGIQMLWA